MAKSKLDEVTAERNWLHYQLFRAVEGEQLNNMECSHGVPLTKPCDECAEDYVSDPLWRAKKGK